jgi:hypothetical protein
MVALSTMTVAYDETGQPLSLIDLRPMDLGDILDSTIRVYRRNPWTFVCILAAIIGLPVLVTQVANRYIESIFIQFSSPEALQKMDYSAIVEAFQSQEFITAVITMAAAVILMFFLQPIAQAAMVYAVSETILGHTTGFRKSFNAIKGKIPKLIQAYFLYVFIITAIFLPIGILAGILIANLATMNTGNALMNTDATIGLSIFLFLLFPPLIFFLVFLGVKYLFIPHAMVLDGTGVVDSLRRSFRLSSGYWWKVLGTYVVVNFIVGIIGALLGQAVSLMELGLNAAKVPMMVTVSISGAILGTLTILINPVTLIAITLIYYDLRIRKEGFDVILLASSIMGGSHHASETDEMIAVG